MHQALNPRVNEIKRKLWDDYQNRFSALGCHGLTTRLYGAGDVGCFLRKYPGKIKQEFQLRIFNEWLAGIAMLYVKKSGAHYATVFTTHATMLGRTLANFDSDIHKEIRDGIKARKNG